MSITKLKLVLLMFLSLSMTNINSQKKLDSKTKYKRIKKLRKKYKFTISLDTVDVALVGTTPSKWIDGKTYNYLVSDVKIIDLSDRKLKPHDAPYNMMQFSIATRDYRYDNGYFRVFDKNNKMGLIDIYGNVLIKPQFDEIGAFNKEGLAVATIGNKLNVINLQGKTQLKEPYKYIFDNKKYNWKNGREFPVVHNGKLIISKDNKKFGLLDIKTNKIVSPIKYDEIKEIYIGDYKKLGLLAKINNQVTILDKDNGKELVKPVFQYFLNYLHKNKKYLTGVTPDNKMNAIDLDTKEFVFPDEMAKKLTKIMILTSDIFAVELKNNNSKKMWGVYDIAKKNYIIKPTIQNVQYGNYVNTPYFVVFKSFKNKYRLYSLKTGKLINNDPNTDYKILKMGPKKKIFLLVWSQPDRHNSKTFCSLYSSDGKTVFSKAEMNYTHLTIKKDFFYIEEHKNCYPCIKLFTAYDFNGNLIGEKYKYLPPTKK